MTLTIGSLFSGIGGLELGLERAGLGPVVWQCEIDPFCRSVLEKHWPGVERYDDVKTIRAAHDVCCDLDEYCECGGLPWVDLICGGFPCQDISSAGRGAGLAGDRSGLWFEFARLVFESRPPWVVIENSGSRIDRWVDSVCEQLEAGGYKTLPLPLSAQNAGAPHRRNRVWVVAHADTCGRESEQTAWVYEKREPGNDAHGRSSYPPRRGDEAGWRHFVTERGGCEPGVFRGAHGLLSELDRQRLRAIGNSAVPDCAEIIGWVIRELIAEDSRPPPARGK
jgi:DNA (cytosine-5)-methyltransferase 1